MFCKPIKQSQIKTCRFAALTAAAVFVVAAPALAQSTKVAIIDVEQVVRGSSRGQAATAELDTLRDEKEKALAAIAEQMKGLQTKVSEGRLTLAEEKLAEMQKQYEDLAIRLRREEDDAKRELQVKQQEVLQKIEAQVMPIINEIGKQGGYSLIFNKFGSGLVYADESTDITGEVIRRFDAAGAGS